MKKKKSNFLIYDQKLDRYRLNGGRFVSRSDINKYKNVYLFKTDKFSIKKDEYYYNQKDDKFYKNFQVISEDEIIEKYNKRNIKMIKDGKIYRSHTKLDSIKSKKILKNTKTKETKYKNVTVKTDSIDISDYFKVQEGIYIIPVKVKEQQQIIKDIMNGIYPDEKIRLWIYFKIEQLSTKDNLTSFFEVSTIQLTEEEKTTADIKAWYEDVYEKLASDAVNKKNYNALVYDVKAVIVFKRW